MTFKVTASTMGVSTPATVAEGTRYYRYNGDQPDKKAPPGGGLPQNRIASAAKRKRMAEYTRLRLADVSKEDAAAAIEISASTMGYYERDFLAQHPQARRRQAEADAATARRIGEAP